MEITSKLYVMALAVTTLALAPTLIVINSADASSHYCRHQKVKSQNWINGCQQGWWDHNHCNPYSPDDESNDFYNGYKVGWNKGHCK